MDKSTKTASVKQANPRLETAICTANVMEEFQTWKQRWSKNAMFRATLNYMHRVEVVVFFVAASRNADMSRGAAGEQQGSSRGAAGEQQGSSRGAAGEQQGSSRGAAGEQQGSSRGAAGEQQGTSRGAAGDQQGSSRGAAE